MKRLVRYIVMSVCSVSLVGCMNVNPTGDSAQTAGGSLTAYAVSDQPAFTDETLSHYGFVHGEPSAQTYYFSFDSNRVRPAYDENLAAQAYYLRAHQTARVLLAGHTDEVGSREYNIALGERRAKAIEQVLEAAGVLPAQIKVVSYGEEKPAVLGHSEAAHVKNRRVELTWRP